MSKELGLGKGANRNHKNIIYTKHKTCKEAKENNELVYGCLTKGRTGGSIYRKIHKTQ